MREREEQAADTPVPAEAVAPALPDLEALAALGAATGGARGATRAAGAAIGRLQRSAGNRAVQRAVAARTLQRRIKARGDVDGFIAIAGPATGLGFSHDAGTGITAVEPGAGGKARSPSFRRLLLDIAQSGDDVELEFGRKLPNTLVGSFPTKGPDEHGHLEQRIDLDDVEAIERGAPGNGLAKLAHEIAENFHGHAHPVHGSGDERAQARFQSAHFGGGVPAEEAVLRDLGIGGERLGERTLWGGPDGKTAVGFVVDYVKYLLLQKITWDAATKDSSYTFVQRVQPDFAETITVFGWAEGSAALPEADRARLEALGATLVDTPGSVIRVEGIVDEKGTRGLARQRAEAVRDVIAARIMQRANEKDPQANIDMKKAGYAISVLARDPVPGATGGGRVDVSLMKAPGA